MTDVHGRLAAGCSAARRMPRCRTAEAPLPKGKNHLHFNSRLAALQAAGANDWRARVCRLSPEKEDSKAIERAKNRINDLNSIEIRPHIASLENPVGLRILTLFADRGPVCRWSDINIISTIFLAIA
ncbi:unnamed protein product [Chilo suppressalis]|uniref:Uncharacterized protein n=1 Tax=Chilo suppressalis TaxID=168631 RepID=A0ABN8AVI6_CHISP|nr:unnamed protein product [Chilo suppressalis]